MGDTTSGNGTISISASELVFGRKQPVRRRLSKGKMDVRLAQNGLFEKS
jgi:hypothetical protein